MSSSKLPIRLLLSAILLSGVCCAQAPPSPLNRRILNQIRSTYSARPDVNITLGERKPSEFTGFDLLPATITDGSGKVSTLKLLLSKDGKTLMRSDVKLALGERKPSEFAGFEELPVTITGSSGNVTTQKMLISKDSKQIVRMEKIPIDDDPMAQIDLHGRPVRGARNAAVTIVNFDDFQCPFCSRMHQTLFPGLLKEYGERIKVIYKDYPLFDIHPWALHAAIDANCLGAQNDDAYWSFADYVHANQREISGDKIPAKVFATLDRIAAGEGRKRKLDEKALGACISAQSDKAVRASAAEGSRLGVDSTPTLFVNGEKISGALPDEEIEAVIDRALRDAGQKPPVHKAEAPASAGGSQ